MIGAEYLTKERLDKLLVNAGFAINANGGRCAVIEDVLIETGSVACAATRVVEERAALLASCKELRDALAGVMRVISRNGLTDAFMVEMRDIDIGAGVGIRADAAIAAAEQK